MDDRLVLEQGEITTGVFTREGDFAKVAGGMLLVMGIGLAIGPAVASLLMNLFKPVGLFIVTATFQFGYWRLVNTDKASR